MVGELGERTAAEQAERAIARTFVAARIGQLAFSAFMVIGDRRRFRRPRLQVALLIGSVIESAWLGYRILRADHYRDRTAMWIDAAWSAGGLMACELGLDPEDGAPWMKNLAIGAAIGAGASEERVDRAGILAVLGLAATVAGVRAKGRDAHVAGLALAVNDIINWTGSHAAVSTYVGAHRRQARLQDDADRLALENATRAAAQSERTQHHQLVHHRTVEVLQEMARSHDERAVADMARREAGRLRHILRGGGDMPTDLDRALRQVAETAEGEGLHIELVTAELLAGVAPDGIGPIRDAVELSVVSAREFAGAERGVVRAAGESGWVTVTIRHHARGFSPGDGSPYDRCLSGLSRIVEPIGGRAEVWSEEGRGVRVTLMVPAAVPTGDGSGRQGEGHQSAEGVPHLPVGNGATRHHDGTVNEGDIDGRAVGGIVRRSQHQVEGIGTITDRHAGPGRQTFEPGPKEGSAGDDADGGGRLHGSRMAPSRSPVLVRNDPIRADGEDGWLDEATQANRTIVALLMSWRVSGLVTGLAAVVAGRRRYRSQSAAVGQLVAVGAESVWLARHLRGNAYRFDRRALTVDLVTAVAALLVGRGNLDPDDRWTWIDWVPWSFATNAVAGRAVAGDAPMAGALGATVIVGTGASLAGGWGDRLVNAGGMAAHFAAAKAFVGQIRKGGARIETARSDALDEGRRLAVEQERSRQLRFLHDSALQTLEAIGTGRYGDLASIRSLALEEAGRLGDELDGIAPPTGPLREELEALVDGHARRGLDIDLQVRTTTEPSPPVLLALRDACHEALVNVGKHAGGHRARVVAGDDTGGITVTVEDDGTGFDPSLGTGFGTTRSIVGRMAEVGGRARIESAPGHGTRVRLWGPA